MGRYSHRKKLGLKYRMFFRFISGEELSSVMSTLGEMLSEEEIQVRSIVVLVVLGVHCLLQEMIREADQDGDGKVLTQLIRKTTEVGYAINIELFEHFTTISVQCWLEVILVLLI